MSEPEGLEIYGFTEHGLDLVLDIHRELTELNWSHEEVAIYHDIEVDQVRLLVAILYYFAEQAGIELIDIPDDLEGLTANLELCYN